jgi:UDP-GlcNAc:undecaprenyl-phosphate/decaprenyl-phosphate GlcNAc-1-phosphate transferase
MRWLIVSFALGVMFTWLVRLAARFFGVVNHPNPIVPQHRAPVAYLGGIAIGLTMLATTLIASTTRGTPVHDLVPARVWLPAMVFLMLGTADDIRPMRAITKLLLQVAASLLAVSLGMVWRVTGVGPVDAGLSVLWFVLLVNAFNVTDVCDGLVAGLAVITLAFAGAQNAAWVPIISVGATLGLLVFNRPPASIFLGDGGSHLLGFLAGAALMMPEGPVPWKSVLAATLATGVVMLEVALLVYSRLRAGIPWWRGSAHHFSLRMQARGLSRLATDVVAWSAAAVLCAIAWFIPSCPDVLAGTLAIAVMLALIVAIHFLLRWEVRA